MTLQPPGPPLQPDQPPRSPYQHASAPVPPPAPPGWVALTVQGSVMTSNMIPPKVRLNGYPITVSYGANPVPVHPGRIRVDASCHWLREYGQASLDVEVGPGQTVPVFYAPPYHQFRRGRMGHVRQERSGILGLVVISLLAIGLPLGAVALVVLRFGT